MDRLMRPAGSSCCAGRALALVVFSFLSFDSVRGDDPGSEKPANGALPTSFETAGARDDYDCGYQAPAEWLADYQNAVRRGEIRDPSTRTVPRVRTSRQALAASRGAGESTPTCVPTPTTDDIFIYEDTTGLLLTNFSDGQLFALMTDAANALLVAEGDNFDFVAFWVNFTPNHTLGTAFYLGLENDVSGIGLTLDNSRPFIGLAGDNVEGFVMMWNINSGFWQPGTGANASLTRLVLGQEFEHRFGMFLPNLLDGRALQGTAGCGRGAHWNFRVDGQGSGMEIREWVGESPAVFGGSCINAGSSLCFNTDAGGVFSYSDLYLMGYVSPEEMDAGNSELRYMDDGCFAPYDGPISTFSSADIIASAGERFPTSTTAQKHFRTGWIMVHQPGDPPSETELAKATGILSQWTEEWSAGTLGRGTMNNTLLATCDCNTNGINDADEIAAGTSEDCNGNRVPDECEPDLDCNGNGIQDICDTATGVSLDCNRNEVPDECEPDDDCNNNGTRDICETADGTAPDCNNNDVPDACDLDNNTSDDVNSDGVPDECTGPCCLCTSCEDTTELQCTLLGGSFLGLGALCGDITCTLPTNDDCSAAVVLPGDLSLEIPFDNRCATNDGPSPLFCDNGTQPFGADLWYEYTSPCDGFLTVNLCRETSFDAILGIYEASSSCQCPTNNDALVVCSDDSCGGGGGPPKVTIRANEGSCYSLRIAGWNGSTGVGAFELDLICTDCPFATAPRADAFEPNNRYLTFSGGDPGGETAMRVTFVDLPGAFSVFDGAIMWVAAPKEVSTLSGSREPVEGAPNIMVATLACEPFYTDWSVLGTIHVHHENIVPLGRYKIDAINVDCPKDVTINFSAAVSLNLSRWGDVTGQLVNGRWAEPDGNINITSDIVAMLDTFSNRPGAPDKIRVDLEPGLVDQTINISDVSRALEAFRGVGYPFAVGTDPCSD